MMRAWRMLALTPCLFVVACSSSHMLKGQAATPSHMRDIGVLWQTEVDNRKPYDPETYARPAVTGLISEAHIVLAGNDARAHVLDLDGHEVFRLALQDTSDSGAVALKNGFVVLGDSGGMLYAIDPVGERMAWSLQLSAAVTGTPVALGEDVLVQTIDDHIYRISAEGEKQWVFSSARPETLGMYVSPSPIVHHERVYAVLESGDVLALDAESGDVLWRKQLLIGNREGALGTMRVPLAAPLWLPKLKLEGRTMQDVLLVPFYQGELFVLDARDGASLMSRKLSLKSAPLLRDGRLFLADAQGVVQAWDVEKGIVLWRRPLSSGALMGPVWWKDSLWVQDDRGMLFRISVDGDMLGKRRFSARFDRLPVITDRGLLYHDNLGGLVLVRG